MLNVTVDRRHDRRPLSEEEFTLLVEAAMVGPEVVCIPGPGPGDDVYSVGVDGVS